MDGQPTFPYQVEEELPVTRVELDLRAFAAVAAYLGDRSAFNNKAGDGA
jgi:hypothetical protein